MSLFYIFARNEISYITKIAHETTRQHCLIIFVFFGMWLKK